MKSEQGERGRKEGVQRAVLFGRHPENTGSRGKPNRCKGGGEEKRRGQNTELGGSDPTFRPCGLESDPWGRSRPAAQKTTPPVLAPSPQGEEKRRELEERKEKASAKRCETASHLEEESPSRTRRQRTARRLCRVHRNQCGGCAEYRAEKNDRQRPGIPVLAESAECPATEGSTTPRAVSACGGNGGSMIERLLNSRGMVACLLAMATGMTL